MIPVNTPILSGNEKKYLAECIDTGWISSEGPFVKRFEDEMANRTNRKHGVAVCNGSAALELAVKALGISDGDEVIMPSFTIISCALAVLKNGGKPVYVDSDLNTWNMVVEDIEGKITTRTKAIMIVHIYGLTVDMDPILKLAEKYDLKIIEDAAEVIGQEYKGQPCGSFGDVSTFSFYPNKHVTTGEGGMVMVNDANLYDRCLSLRNLAFGKANRFCHEDIGWNFRMTNLQAAIGVAQLEYLDDNIKRKREIGRFYQTALSECKHLQLPLYKTDYCKNIYWVFGLLSTNLQKNAEYWRNKLAEYEIGTRPFFYPMHLQPLDGIRSTDNLPNAEQLASQGFYIPSGLGISDEELHFVAESIIKESNH
jgi:perosamine synthetase